MNLSTVIGDVGDVDQGGIKNLGWKSVELDERGGLSFILGGVLGIFS